MNRLAEGYEQAITKLYYIIITILYSDCFNSQDACFLFLEESTAFKESMINQLSNLITRNCSAAKISQVLCSNFHGISWFQVGFSWYQVNIYDFSWLQAGFS